MIYVFLANGFEEIEALTPIDLLRRAGHKVTTVGVGSARINGAHGISVIADIQDKDFDDNAPEMVILPGGMPGAENLDSSDVVDDALKKAYAANGYICAICAAPFVLGKRGYLKGKKAICYPGFEKYLNGAEIVKCAVVRDGKVITAVGMGAATAFGLELVASLDGEKAALELKNKIIAE